MLLRPKKRLAFNGGTAALVLFLAAGAAVSVPRPASAGLFTVLSRLFNSTAEVEERPLSPAAVFTTAVAASALEAENRPPAGDRGEDETLPLAVVRDNAIAAPLNPLGIIAEAPPAGQIYLYTVRGGDTLSAVAKSFDVTVNTILWANNISDFRSLKIGQTLVILPVSGIRHEVKQGDSLAAIAKRYRAGIEDILSFNGLAADEALVSGNVVIVPNGELYEAAPLTPGLPSRSLTQLPLYDGYYLRPIVGGRRSRGLHGYNGVDLAGSCGMPVLASADGQVLITRLSGWNGGYGRYVVVAHANNTQTLYAHLREVTAASGQAVAKGALIGTIGSSGNSTGCHLHFEVRGAKNPF